MKWSADELALLKRMDARRVPIDGMAERLSRSRDSVEMRLKLIRMSPEQQKAYHRRKYEVKKARAAGLSLPPRNAPKKRRRKLPTRHIQPYWHGRCPAFRPLLDIDTNRSTRL